MPGEVIVARHQSRVLDSVAGRETTSAVLMPRYLDREAETHAALEMFFDHAREEMTPFPGDDPKAWRTFFARTVTRHRMETFEHIVEGARRAELLVAQRKL